MTSRFARALKAKQTSEDKDDGATTHGRWSNIDLEPTPPTSRNWSGWYFFAFQFSIAFSPTTYNIGSSLYAIGLTWQTIIIASFVGTGLCCVVIFFNARGATLYHIGFPVYVRISAETSIAIRHRPTTRFAGDVLRFRRSGALANASNGPGTTVVSRLGRRRSSAFARWSEFQWHPSERINGEKPTAS